MAFQVERPGLAEQPYGNDDIYEVLEGGVLTIHRGDPKFDDESYPPDKWDFVCTDGDHRPGFTSGEAAVPSVVGE
jgi:hypothetical protein